MVFLVFYEGVLHSIHDSWVYSGDLPSPCYVRHTPSNEDYWYLVRADIGAVCINLCDVPSKYLQLVQMLNLVVTK